MLRYVRDTASTRDEVDKQRIATRANKDSIEYVVKGLLLS
jgi:hypothetical protein